MTSPLRSVLATIHPASSKQVSVSFVGCPYLLFSPTLISAISGDSSEVMVSERDSLEPWCATLRTSISESNHSSINLDTVSCSASPQKNAFQSVTALLFGSMSNTKQILS